MDNTVAVMLSRYEKLLDLETRVEIAVDYLANNDTCDEEIILRILGTELALEKADKLKEEKEARREYWQGRYRAVEEVDPDADV